MPTADSLAAMAKKPVTILKPAPKPTVPTALKPVDPSAARYAAMEAAAKAAANAKKNAAGDQIGRRIAINAPLTTSTANNPKPFVAPKTEDQLGRRIALGQPITTSSKIATDEGIIAKKNITGTDNTVAKVDTGGGAGTGTDTGTGTGESGGGGLQTDFDTQVQVSDLEAQNAANKALRAYQEGAARRDLQSALKLIDRNALEQYKGIADDYAGRGMLRSGGFLKTSDKAALQNADTRTTARNALEDILKQNELSNLSDAQSTATGSASLLQNMIAGILAKKTNQIGTT